MTKKILTVAFALVLALSFALTGCNFSNTPGAGGDDSWNKIAEKKLMIVGLDVKFPPMGFMDENNSIVGFDVDMAMAVGKKLGISVQLNPIDWKSKEMELKSGKVDVLWNGYTITEERKKEVLFSEPYLNNRQIVIVKQDSPINKKDDLAGVKIGLQSGSTAYDAIQADPLYPQLENNLMMYDDNNTAMMDLDVGRTQAVVVDEVVGNWYLSKHQGKYRILDEDFGSEQYGVGFRKEDKAFRDKVQEALNELKADGTAAKISTKWFGADVVL